MVTYSHHVPGRLRVRIAQLKRNTAAAQALCEALRTIDGVGKVTSNPATGSVTILYDRHGIAPSVLWDTIRHFGYLDDVPARRAPASTPVADKLAAAAADHVSRAVLDFALERMFGRPVAMVIGALI